MKHTKTIIFGVFVLVIAGVGQADEFVLENDDFLKVDSWYSKGVLWDFSIASIVQDGLVGELETHNSSTAHISGGGVWTLSAGDTSTVNVSDGSVELLFVHNAATVNISGGSVGEMFAPLEGDSTVTVSGGNVETLATWFTSTVDISGGSIAFLQVNDFSTVDISGGIVSELIALNYSTVTLWAKEFILGSGLWLIGDELFGTGTLSGQWPDGTTWTTEIILNDGEATIMAIRFFNMADFNNFSKHWLYSPCDFFMNNWCERADLDENGTVDINDLLIFADRWLGL